MMLHAKSWKAALLGVGFLSVLNPVSVRSGEPSMQAVSAASFVDSIGVNTHLTYTQGPYGRHWDGIRDVLINSGIHHIRDGLFDHAFPSYFDRLNELGNHGIGVTAIADWDDTPRALADFSARVNMIDAYENPNEADGRPQFPDWAERLRTFAPVLYRAAKRLPTPLPVIGPSLMTCNAYHRLGDLSTWFDIGNTHDYFSGRNPGTLGYGRERVLQPNFGSLTYRHDCARAVAGSRPMSVTESGFTMSRESKIGIPAELAVRYVPRLFFEQWRSGMTRTFEYELVNEGTSETESHYGLLEADLTPKPGFLALTSLIAALKDDGAPFSPSALQLAVDTANVDVHTLLFEKSDKTFVLAIWRELPCYDVPRRATIAVQPAPVTLRFAKAVAQPISISTLSDGGRFVPSTRPQTGATIPLNVDDHVSLVTFKMANN